MPMYAVYMSKKGLLCLLATAAFAQAPKTAMFDSRLPVHTILREDIFAGFMVNDMDRLARGEKTLEVLVLERPEDKAPLSAWKAAIALQRAVLAHEGKRSAEFEREYRKALELYAEAERLGPKDGGVTAVTAGSYALFADRLPEPYRVAAWSAAYKAYGKMWQEQAGAVDHFPLHLKGELLAGMAQSAQRTGHAVEGAQFLERIVKTMPGTAYASMAQKWIDAPEVAATTKLTCQSCHDAGRLAARTAAFAAAK